jgi:hypothetical protein
MRPAYVVESIQALTQIPFDYLPKMCPERVFAFAHRHALYSKTLCQVQGRGGF